MITKAIAGSYFFTKMAEGTPAAHDNYDTCEEVIVAARNEIAEATRLTFHIKTLVVVSDDHHRILWAAASDGWETDYRPGSAPEMIREAPSHERENSYSPMSATPEEGWRSRHRASLSSWRMRSRVRSNR